MRDTGLGNKIVDWPKEPYKGFAFYTAEDEPLLAGRADDVSDCLECLSEPGTRTVLLHGRTGVGKSSFLRAGLIPALEGGGRGFLLVRRGPGEPPSIVRCTSDPMARIAEELFHFSSRTWHISTTVGVREVDLSSVHSRFDGLPAFVSACRNPEVLMSVLAEIADLCIAPIVIFVDQAEEAITGIGRRAPFFDFLKLFNASTIRVKLLIILRTERFGEFFGYMHVGASVITDVKQIFLRSLERSEVKQAIELPTSREGSEDCGSPYDAYGFQYEEGLVDIIVNDLFEAPPSGGMLPLMQVVCRSLYNEVRHLSAPRLITRAMYLAGDRGVGRIDRQIADSILDAFKEVHPSVAGPEEEERRWRAGLYKLVRTQPDGTADTNMKTKAEFLQLLAEANVQAPKQPVLDFLARPDILILRNLPAVLEGGSEPTDCYCLGHDAIALALRQWSLREEEAEKHRLREERARRRRHIYLSVVAVGAAALTASLAYIGLLLRNEALSMHAFAERSFRSDPRAAAGAAIRAATYEATVLAKIAATLPRRKIHSEHHSEHIDQRDVGVFLPRSKRLLFWHPASGLDLVSADGSEQSRRIPAEIFGWDEKADPSLLLASASETTDGLLVLQFDGSKRLGAQSIVILDKDIILDRRDKAFFIEKTRELRNKPGDIARLFDPFPSALQNATDWYLQVADNTIFLVWRTSKTVLMQSFFLKRDGDSVQIEPGSTLVHPAILQESLQIGAVGTSPPALALIRDVDSANDRPDEPRFQEFWVYDMAIADRPAKSIWSLGSQGPNAALDCVGRVESSTGDQCTFTFNGDSRSGFFAIQIPRGKSRPSEAEVAIIDPVDRSAVEVPWNTLSATWRKADFLRGPLSAGSLDNETTPLAAAKVFAIGGTPELATVAVSSDRLEEGISIFDVFLVRRDQVSFVGTYLNPSQGGLRNLRISNDGRQMVLVSGSDAYIWDISVTGPELAAGYLKNTSVAQMTDMICALTRPAALHTSGILPALFGGDQFQPCPADRPK